MQTLQKTAADTQIFDREYPNIGALTVRTGIRVLYYRVPSKSSVRVAATTTTTITTTVTVKVSRRALFMVQVGRQNKLERSLAYLGLQL